MTAQPHEPDPANTPGLDAGGGVSPGSTPPAAAQTAAVAEPHPPGKRAAMPGGIVPVIAVCLFVVLFAAVGVLLVMKIFGLTG